MTFPRLSRTVNFSKDFPGFSMTVGTLIVAAKVHFKFDREFLSSTVLYCIVLYLVDFLLYLIVLQC